MITVSLPHRPEAVLAELAIADCHALSCLPRHYTTICILTCYGVRKKEEKEEGEEKKRKKKQKTEKKT